MTCTISGYGILLCGLNLFKLSELRETKIIIVILPASCGRHRRRGFTTVTLQCILYVQPEEIEKQLPHVTIIIYSTITTMTCINR